VRRQFGHTGPRDGDRAVGHALVVTEQRVQLRGVAREQLDAHVLGVVEVSHHLERLGQRAVDVREAVLAVGGRENAVLLR